MIPHAQVEPGYCTGSSAVTPRVDAWRCVEGTTTLDPCFSSEFANGVVCATPWTDSAIEITLTRPLPKATNQVVPSLQLAAVGDPARVGRRLPLRADGRARQRLPAELPVCNAKLSLWG